MEVAVTLERPARGRCRTIVRKFPANESRTTKRRKIRRRHPARNSRSFQKMAFAPRMGPWGGAIGEGGGILSGFWASVMNSFRPVLGVSFEAREIILIAARHGVPRHEPVHHFAEQAGQRVV